MIDRTSVLMMIKIFRILSERSIFHS
jgi:hypothetical protein